MFATRIMTKSGAPLIAYGRCSATRLMNFLMEDPSTISYRMVWTLSGCFLATERDTGNHLAKNAT